MGTKVSDTGGNDFVPVPAGLHRAICIAYIDLGTQEGQKYMEPNETVLRPKVAIVWETPDERIDIDGELKPQNITKFYTKSISQKANLAADLESWRGKAFTEEERKGFDLDNILGVPCQINVVHEFKNGKARAKLANVLPLSKGMPKPTPSIKPWRYDIFEDGMNFPPQLSEGFKKIIMRSQEILNPRQPIDPGVGPEEEIPTGDEIPF